MDENFLYYENRYKSKTNICPQTEYKSNILFLGNCQMSIYLYLNQMDFIKKYFQLEQYLIFKLNEQEMMDILNNIHKYKYIVTQSISTNFRDNPIYSTNHLLSLVNRKFTKIIMFPSCYFDFSYPYTTSKNKIYIEGLIDELFTDSPTENNLIDKFIRKLNDPNYISIEEMALRFKDSMEKIIDREKEAVHLFCPDHFVKISDFIVKHKRECLFYTFNHPSKILLSFIALEIAKFIFLKENNNNNNKGGTNNNSGHLKDASKLLECKDFIESNFSFSKYLDPLDKYKSPILQCFQPFFDYDLKLFNQNLSYKGQKCNATTFFYLYCHLFPPKKNKSIFLSNKNICSYMDSKIYQCNNLKKTTTKKSAPVFIKCVTTSTMNSNSNQNSNIKPILTSVSSTTSPNRTVEIGTPTTNIHASVVHKKKKQLPKTLVKQNISKTCIN